VNVAVIVSAASAGAQAKLAAIVKDY